MKKELTLGFLALAACANAMGGGDAGPPNPNPIFADGGVSDDPATCDEAVQSSSNVGCDYWPTVLANSVWSVFDYAVVVVNPGQNPANVTVTRPSVGYSTAVTVAPGALEKIYLPWVPELKGPTDANAQGRPTPLANSMLAPGGAYHLQSDRPLIAYQFNALEYAAKGGPPGKDWSSCPGNDQVSGCFSFTNDATLLLPSHVLTPNYVVTSIGDSGLNGLLTITATSPGTTSVDVTVPPNATLFAGASIVAGKPGDHVALTLAQGDVAELVSSHSAAASDWSGARVAATAPVQVIAGVYDIQLPSASPAADHVEQIVPPLETFGKSYVVAMPETPDGQGEMGIVRLYAGLKPVHLDYAPAAPSGCPTDLAAGAFAQCDIAKADFQVTGDEAFAVDVFQLGGTIVDPKESRGDPSQSMVVPVEQYRKSYVFLAPDDYDVSYAQITIPSEASSVTLDGTSLLASATPVGSGWSVARVKLDSSAGGTHRLVSAGAPVGLQVEGYGSYTSYQFPGGLDSKPINPVVK